MDVLYLIILGLGVVVVTRFVLCEGIERLAAATNLSSKTKGQILGYSTSLPELVGTASTAWLGLLGAGLWNIAASNIINLGLFISANIYFKQHRALTEKKFLDEAGFAVGAILIPLVLVFGGGAEQSIWTAVLLFAAFLIYIIADKKLNRESGKTNDGYDGDMEGPRESHVVEEVAKTKVIVGAVSMILAGLGLVVLLGNFLGGTAERVVRTMGIPQVGVGWILGVATSLPELTSFFSIYGVAKKKGRLGSHYDTQEALDNLAASNMSNLGLVYPIGIILFILAGH